jgi:hypothetical protein
VAPSGIQVGQPGDCAPWAVVDWSAPANGRGTSQDRALGGGDPPAR